MPHNYLTSSTTPQLDATKSLNKSKDHCWFGDKNGLKWAFDLASACYLGVKLGEPTFGVANLPILDNAERIFAIATAEDTSRLIRAAKQVRSCSGSIVVKVCSRILIVVNKCRRAAVKYVIDFLPSWVSLLIATSGGMGVEVPKYPDVSGFEPSYLVTSLQHSTEGSAEVAVRPDKSISPIGVSFQAGHSSLKSTVSL
nr:hypothetical transcript [Hymenolepis microstoma]